MGNALRYLNLVLLFTALVVLSAGGAVLAEDDQQEILVGRITHVEGELLRYIEDDKDWVLTVKDAPFGLEDALYSGEEAKAEFIMPNWTWFRVGGSTQLQLIALSTEATSMDVAAGLARVYNKSDDAVVKVTTPFGYVVAPGGTAFDLYVGDDSLEVIAIQGSVDFVHEGTEVKYEVEEGSSSIIANADEAGHGNGAVDSDWDDWNGKRDDIWMERLQRSESSAEFLPDPIRYESYALEENGRWERVYYEGEYHDMWRPTRVDPGWRPFTAGRWTVYYGDNCWIPDESFGYVTHHYGSWVYIESFRAWYWAPPAPRFVVDTPSVFIGFGWYPGRVGWIHSGPSIGWVPLAPNEVYYGYRPWGRRTVIVKHNTVINISTVRFRYLDEAVIIDRDHFYRGSRYTPHVKRDVRRDVLINSYRPVTVINNTVINNFNSDKRRFAYNDVKVSRKPHVSVVNRINDNDERSNRNFGRGNRERIKGDLARINTGSELSSKSEIRKPMLATRLVDAGKTSQPLDRLSSEKKEIKPRDRERQVRAGNEERSRSGEQGQFDKTRDNAGQEEKRRLKSPKESRDEKPEQVGRQQDQIRPPDAGGRRQEPGTQQRQVEEGKGRERQQPPSPRVVKGKTEEELQQGRTAPPSDDQRRLRSPRDRGDREAEHGALQQDQGRPEKESQVRQEPKLNRQPPENSGQRQERQIQQRQEEEGKGREGQQPPSPKTVRGKQQEEPQQVLTPPPSDDQRRIKPPRDRENRENEQSVARQDQVRQQKENQMRQEQEAGRQQEEDGERRQAREIQQRQAEEVKAKQEAERNAPRQDQVRQQKENQVRQEQEVRRQQEDGKRRQEQEAQRQRDEEVKARQAGEQRVLQQEQARQQKENQVRQEQEVRRQQEEGKRRQEQEVQQRRGEEVKARQAAEQRAVQQEQARQQKDNQVRQAQEARRQQEEGKRRQEQEAQQVKQRPEKQRQQPEAAPNPQGQQPQASKNKSKKQLEEEERLLREQQAPKK